MLSGTTGERPVPSANIRQDSELVTTMVPVVFLVPPVTVLFSLYPVLVSIVSLTR